MIFHVAWASHSRGLGFYGEHLKMSMAIPGEPSRTCLGYSEIVLEDLKHYLP